jgi:hypothetical protein
MSTPLHFYYGANGPIPGIFWQLGSSWVGLRYDTDVPELITNPATLQITTEVEPFLLGFVKLAYEVAIQESCAPVQPSWSPRLGRAEGPGD